MWRHFTLCRPINCNNSARSELRKLLFLALSDFFVCVWNISGATERICAKFTQNTFLVPRSDEFKGQSQRSKVKVTRDKIDVFQLCVRFMFGKTSLACSFLFVYETSREPLNGFGPNSHGRRVWSLAGTSLKVTVRRKRSKSPRQKQYFSALSAACVRLCLVKHL